MRFLVTYTRHDIQHARCVDACCEAAAIEATQRHDRWGSAWTVRTTRDDATPDIVGGAAACPLSGRHEEIEP